MAGMSLIIPPKLAPCDRVAVVSPSFAVPGRLPEVHELAMRRLQDDLGLVPVEYPTTRRIGATPADRAADLNAAFSDPSIRAVMATIGGDDQITVLRHLDPTVVRADPKPFFGFSDNTNLLNWLWFHGVAAFHGGSTQIHLGRLPEPHPVSMSSLRAALFAAGDLEITEVDGFSEDEFGWDDPQRWTTAPPVLPASPWTWHQPETVVRARTWGGNLEILEWVLSSNRYVHEPAAYAGCVLLLETSEEMPHPDEVFRILRNMGERGLLEQFPAALVARPKASFVLAPKSPDERRRYRDDQRAAVLRAFADYNPAAMLVFDIDFGHTDPQWVLPYGGPITVDGPARRITAHLAA
jgi:muramoyltetrapeptide carboxypeptidase LdcA involved in peptidoglycan recycling